MVLAMVHELKTTLNQKMLLSDYMIMYMVYKIVIGTWIIHTFCMFYYYYVRPPLTKKDVSAHAHHPKFLHFSNAFFVQRVELTFLF